MNIICALTRHEADRRQVYNGGYHFSRCRRCRCDMIGSAGEWSAVPAGHRVTWKAGRHAHSLEPDLSRVLPVLHEQANLPAVRPSFVSWSRQLARLLTPRGRKDRVEEDKEARENEPYPALLVLAALVGAGLQMLFGFGGRRRETI